MGLSLLIVKQVDFFFSFLFFSILYTVHWVCPSSPAVLRATSNSHSWLQSHGCISDGVRSVHFLFSVVVFFYRRQNESLKPKKRFSAWSSNSQDSRRSGWRQRFYWEILGPPWIILFVCLFVFLMSHVTHPTLNELLARSLGVLSQTGIYGSVERLSGVSFHQALRFFFLSNHGSPTLHSDQSFPGIPVRLCSKTGIDPRKQKKNCQFSLSALEKRSHFHF